MFFFLCLLVSLGRRPSQGSHQQKSAPPARVTARAWPFHHLKIWFSNILSHLQTLIATGQGLLWVLLAGKQMIYSGQRFLQWANMALLPFQLFLPVGFSICLWGGPSSAVHWAFWDLKSLKEPNKNSRPLLLTEIQRALCISFPVYNQKQVPRVICHPENIWQYSGKTHLFVIQDWQNDAAIY